MKAEKELEWQRLYHTAIGERDPERIPEEIARAEAAIQLRIKRDKLDEVEKQAIDDALQTLRNLKVQYFPGWNYRAQPKKAR